nr:cytochrome P450 2J2-like [Macaca fascicularis]
MSCEGQSWHRPTAVCLFTVWVSPIPIVVLSGFRAVKEALVSNSEQFSGRPLTSLFQDLFGEQGIVCSRRHMWWQQRRFCLVTLQGLGLGKLALEVQLQKQAAELVEAFRQELSRSFDPQVSIVRSTVRVIGALVFGHHFLSEDPIFQELTQAIDFGLALVRTVWHWLHDVFPRALCHLPGPHREIFRYQGVVRSFTRREITGRKLKAPEALKDFINCSLAQISKAMDEPVSTFHEENLVQVVIDLFLGGTNTTATTQRWALVYMIQHGAVQGLLHAESFVPAASFDTMGTIILPLCRGSVLYDPECWETPPQFNPGHFLDKDGNFVANEAFLPFSAGHCVCPGDQLARMELFLMFATLLRTFRFQLPEGSPGLKLEYIFGGTLQPQPQEICAVPRLNSPSPGPREDGL